MYDLKSSVTTEPAATSSISSSTAFPATRLTTVKIKQVLDSVNSRRLRSLLRGLYHREGPGRKPYNPLSMLKAQLLKHLLRIPSDRRLAREDLDSGIVIN